MKKILLLAAVPLLLLSACEGGESSSGNSSSSSTNTSSSQSSVEVPEYDDEYDIATSDYLTEFAVGKVLATGSSCTITVRFPEYGTTVGATAEILQSDIAEISPATEDHSSWTLTGLKAGKFVLIIRDADNNIHLRKTLEVRDPIAIEDMEDYLVYEVDHFQSWVMYFLDMQVTFIGNQTAIATGTDENGSNFGSITFNYEYSETRGDEYIYQVLNWESSATSMVPSNFAIYNTGEMAHLYDGNGVYAVLTPVFA